jgi:hypothetical protein
LGLKHNSREEEKHGWRYWEGEWKGRFEVWNTNRTIVCLVVVQSRALLPFVIYSLRLPKPAFIANSWKSGQSSACRISCGAFIPDKGAHKADVKHGKVLIKRAPFHAASHVTILTQQTSQESIAAGFGLLVQFPYKNLNIHC